MTFTFPERRRAVRATISGPSWLTVPASWTVRLIDLSLGGLSFTSPNALEVGRTLTFRATLGGDALSCQIRVCWSHPRPGRPGGSDVYEIGAKFVPLDDSSRRVLQSFLKLPPGE